MGSDLDSGRGGPPAGGGDARETLLYVLAGAAFLVFFQSYLVAPLIPALAEEMHASLAFAGLLVPAYMIPYGVSALVYGPVSDRLGRKPVIMTLLALMVVTIAGTATARTMGQMLCWRVLGGVASGGIIPIGLALLGDLFPYAERGRPIGWMFGSVAGGMAFGSTAGALLNPLIGWRAELAVTAVAATVPLVVGVRTRIAAREPASAGRLRPLEVARAYVDLCRDRRTFRCYSYIFLNGMFHSGVFSWLGLFFSRRYGLGDVGIGLALLGYGLPGMLLGPLIGGWADRIGRKRLIPAGLLLAAACGMALIPRVPLVAAALAVTVLSLGYDMSHPLLAGIMTSVDPRRRGLAMGVNAFMLFVSFGVGTLAFSWLLAYGFPTALGIFAAVQLGIGILAIPVFRAEDSASEGPPPRVGPD